jgi:hypothetical protein
MKSENMSRVLMWQPRLLTGHCTKHGIIGSLVPFIILTSKQQQRQNHTNQAFFVPHSSVMKFQPSTSLTTSQQVALSSRLVPSISRGAPLSNIFLSHMAEPSISNEQRRRTLCCVLENVLSLVEDDLFEHQEETVVQNKQ